MSGFDVLIVGGGHAGCEAAAVAARMGARTALVTFDLGKIGAMSCNPAIGGLGKGHLVREVDALDGLIGRAADAAAIHYRMLNRSKGSAVHGPRIQADRKLFRTAVRAMLGREANLTIIAGEVARLVLTGGRAAGVVLADGTHLAAKAIILCTGTFLGGRMFRGQERLSGGRVDEPGSTVLALQLREAKLPMGRLKTGTPPRLDGRTIDWALLDGQPSDVEHWTMSPLSKCRRNPQLACAITRTNAQTHDIVRKNLDRSPLFAGAIDAIGPRYCPSIEDKVHRFGDRDGHQVFLEPESLDDATIYPNGISTSLPTDVQFSLLRTMPGLAQVEIVTPGYAVEYDHIDPRALGIDLQLRQLAGLYCAGQINGTTGYEEAAAQGFVAGMNAASVSRGTSPVALDRANSYIAVMVDDLTLQGVSEPYRMLTSRAEYRLRLRANNATSRLTGLGIAAGCVGRERRVWYTAREALRPLWNAALTTNVQFPRKHDGPVGNSFPGNGERRTIVEWMRLPAVTMHDFASVLPGQLDAGSALADEMAEDARYAPYLERQDSELRDLRASESLVLGADFPFAEIAGLSNEMVERLSCAQPGSLSAAGRISGITPAALAALLVHARKMAMAQ